MTCDLFNMYGLQTCKFCVNQAFYFSVAGQRFMRSEIQQMAGSSHTTQEVS